MGIYEITLEVRQSSLSLPYRVTVPIGDVDDEDGAMGAIGGGLLYGIEKVKGRAKITYNLIISAPDKEPIKEMFHRVTGKEVLKFDLPGLYDIPRYVLSCPRDCKISWVRDCVVE